jgi:ketosteroid isomerase-like protein
MDGLLTLITGIIISLGFDQLSWSPRLDRELQRWTVVIIRPVVVNQTNDKLKGKQEVLALLKLLANAGVKREVATLQRFHSDQFFHTNADGSMMSKSEVLASYKVPAQITIESDELHQEKVQLHGDTAIVSCRVTLQGRDPSGRQFTTPFRVTYVLVRENGSWLLVASHASVLR